MVMQCSGVNCVILLIETQENPKLSKILTQILLQIFYDSFKNVFILLNSSGTNSIIQYYFIRLGIRNIDLHAD